MNDPLMLWERYKKYLCRPTELGVQVDVSRMAFDDDFFPRMAEPFARAFAAMQALEGGAIANLSENRMVGHYWLRAADLAPDPVITEEIERTLADIKQFASDVHSGVIAPQKADGFYVVLMIGIGGSALGPQLVNDALGRVDDPMIVRFLDNTDPDGIDRELAELDEMLGQTLTIVVSKSGGTVETRNGMLEVAEAYRKAGLSFAKHAVAVTCDGSELHKKAVKENWLRTFPMWDWVGGRTSVTSAVGLLPATLQGIDVDEFLAGAQAADVATRNPNIIENPAAMLAAMWHYAGDVRGRRNMVVLPYRDRLLLFARYLQQLIMESIGKERDRAGKVIHHGLNVFGNKGTTDQHAYVQQLRDGANDFFATFLQVQKDREGQSLTVETDVTAGDYLHGFLLGTRQALAENGRESITITLDELNARSLGSLIAVFERAVGLYAELVNINAYDQPGVEAGKKAASVVITLQRRVLEHLRSSKGESFTAEQIAAAIGDRAAAESVFHILEHAVADGDHGLCLTGGKSPSSFTFGVK